MSDPDDINFKEYTLSTLPKCEVVWDAAPAPGFGFQSHKFSILDAIETASVFLRTDPSERTEKLFAGFNIARVLATLPQFVAQAGENGLVPKKEGKAFLGTIGRRDILLETSKWMDDYAILSNGTPDTAFIKIINLK